MKMESAKGLKDIGELKNEKREGGCEEKGKRSGVRGEEGK